MMGLFVLEDNEDHTSIAPRISVLHNT